MPATSTGDPATRKTRLLSRQCQTCVFKPGNLMHLAPGRLADLVHESRDTFVVCHATLPGMAPPGYPGPAVCRGFKDAYDTQALQVIERLWGFLLVDPPAKEDPDARQPDPG